MLAGLSQAGQRFNMPVLPSRHQLFRKTSPPLAAFYLPSSPGFITNTLKATHDDANVKVTFISQFYLFLSRFQARHAISDAYIFFISATHWPPA